MSERILGDISIGLQITAEGRFLSISAASPSLQLLVNLWVYGTNRYRSNITLRRKVRKGIGKRGGRVVWLGES